MSSSKPILLYFLSGQDDARNHGTLSLFRNWQNPFLKKVTSYMLDCHNIDHNYMLTDSSKIIMANSGKGMFQAAAW